MKRLLIILQVCMALSGCGGGSGSTNTPSSIVNAPVVTSLTFSPQSAAKNSGGGVVDITATPKISAPDCGVEQYNLMRIDASGKVIEKLIFRSSAPPEARLIQGVAVYQCSTATVGLFPFAISVTDNLGRESNWVYGTFEVTQ